MAYATSLHKNSGGQRGEHVEKTVDQIRAPRPEILAKPARDTFTHKNSNSSTTAAPIWTKGIPFESANRLLLYPQKARGAARIRGGYN
ncbi:hypothetical protein PISMIDRAFT_691033, partial [Pisolithus microcarpus 441]